MNVGRTPRSVLLAALVPVFAVLVACGGVDPTSGEAGASRTVAHARGETEVPASPQRVVVLEPVQLDTVVALGMRPVGAAVLNETAGVPAYLGAESAAIETVGTVSEPSLEAIAALRPDLVLGTESRHSALYEQLSAIAPTVFIANHADPWADNVRSVGRALGADADAQALLDRFQARCAEVAQEHGTAGTTAQLIRPRDGILTLYGPASFAGSTLECAGFTTPARDWEQSISVDLSPELVLEAQADHVFVTAADPTADTAVPPAITSVGAGAFPQLHVVDQAFWITGVGPLGGLTVLDDIDRILSAP